MLTGSTYPFIVTRTSKVLRSGDLFTQPRDQLCKEKDTGAIYNRQKPVALYKQLLEIFVDDKSPHVVDACSGVGSCALACRDLGIKCIVLDKCDIKIRLIKQRAK